MKLTYRQTPNLGVAMRWWTKFLPRRTRTALFLRAFEDNRRELLAEADRVIAQMERD